MSATKPATGWTAETPQTNGIYWWRANERHDEPGIREVTDSLVYRIESRHVSPLKNYGGEWLGPITPADFDQLVALREAIRAEIHRQCPHCKNGLGWTEDGRAHYGYQHQGVVGITACTASPALRNARGLQDGPTRTSP